LAQGITPDQEADAEAAIAACTSPAPGLVVVELPHGKTATVTDRLSTLAGGPRYRNLLVECPNEVSFFGDGKIIEKLIGMYGGYCGGNLPGRGYWGFEIGAEHPRETIRQFVMSHLTDNLGKEAV
jgi:hypothetical protein